MIRNHLVIALIFFSVNLQAQTAHYWTESYGTGSMLLSGVVVGSVQDLGAVYYNPARLAQFKTPAFAHSGQVYELKSVTIINGLGDGLDVADYLQGTSMTPLMKDPDREWKPAAFSQFHRRPKVTPDSGRYMGYSITKNRYHLVEWRTWDNKLGVAGDGVTHELFDLENDSDENINIYQNTEPELISNLLDELHDGWRKAKPVL